LKREQEKDMRNGFKEPDYWITAELEFYSLSLSWPSQSGQNGEV